MFPAFPFQPSLNTTNHLKRYHTMSEASHQRSSILDPIGEDSSPAGNKDGDEDEDEDGDEDARTEEQNATTVFVHFKPQLSAYSCLKTEEIIAEPATRTVLQNLQRLHDSLHNNMEEKVHSCEKAVDAAETVNYPVMSIETVEILEFLDNPPKNGSLTFRKLTEADLTKITGKTTASAGQSIGSGDARQGEERTTRTTPEASFTFPTRSTSETSNALNAESDRSFAGGGHSQSTVLVPPSVEETMIDENEGDAGAGRDVNMSEAWSECPGDGDSQKDPMEIDSDPDEDVKMGGV